jgi:hypothetical protein
MNFKWRNTVLIFIYRLQNAKADVWGDKVTLVFADMRKWVPPTKVKKCITCNGSITNKIVL